MILVYIYHRFHDSFSLFLFWWLGYKETNFNLQGERIKDTGRVLFQKTRCVHYPFLPNSTIQRLNRENEATKVVTLERVAVINVANIGDNATHENYKLYQKS